MIGRGARKLAVLAAATAIVLAGCSGGGESKMASDHRPPIASSAPGSTTTTAATPASAGVVPAAVAVATSGAHAPSTPMAPGTAPSNVVATGAPTTTVAAGPVTTRPPCRNLPAKGGEQPSWVADLPLPPNTYLINVQNDTPAKRAAYFAVPLGIDPFADFSRAEWPPSGWTIGREERDGNEAEASFAKGQRSGAYRVTDVFCDHAWSNLQLVITEPQPSA